jgi:hypothetical protein
MSKTQTTTSKSDPNEAAVAALVSIVELSIPSRTNGSGTPTMDLLVKLSAQAAKLLRLEHDKLAPISNRATLELLRKFDIIAS